jgi:hypothetical protein
MSRDEKLSRKVVRRGKGILEPGGLGRKLSRQVGLGKVSGGREAWDERRAIKILLVVGLMHILFLAEV